MAKRAIVMYLEQARIYGEDLSVTRSEVLLTKWKSRFAAQPYCNEGGQQDDG